MKRSMFLLFGSLLLFNGCDGINSSSAKRLTAVPSSPSTIQSSPRPARSYLDEKIKCSREGRVWFERLEKKRPTRTLVLIATSYNSSLDTCLCLDGGSENGEAYSSVDDVLSDTQLVYIPETPPDNAAEL
jgi:hypothetical protein